MPSVNDYDKNDPDNDGTGVMSGGGPVANTQASATGAPRQAQASKQQEQAYVPWSSFVDANRGAAQHQVDRVNSQVQGEVAGAQQGIQNATNAFNQQVNSNYNREDRIPQTDASGAVVSGPVAPAAKPGFAGHNQGAPLQQRTGGPNQALTEVSGARLGGIKDSALQNGVVGSKDLESFMGADPWASLIGQTNKAQGDAKALGSEHGLEALLQSRSGLPGDHAFDAALMGSVGGNVLDKTAKAGAGLNNQLEQANEASQSVWGRLSGDVAQAQAQKDQQAKDAAAGAQQQQLISDDKAKQDAITKNRQATDDVINANRAGMLAYMGDNGEILGLGSAQDFLNVFRDGKQWDHHQGTAVDFIGDQYASYAMQGLGISKDDLISMVEKMSPYEFQNFFLLGVVPEWADVKGNVQKGVPGGYTSPITQAVLKYGADGGQWNGVTSMWKDSLGRIGKAAAGGPGGITTAAVQTAAEGGRGR